MKRKHIFYTALLSAIILLLSACALHLDTYDRNADNLTIIAKYQDDRNEVVYKILPVSEAGQQQDPIYLISKDRSFDVGDKVKLVKK